MSRKQGVADELSREARAARDLAENGREAYGWRVIDGERRLVLVAIGFTVAAQPYEDMDGFRQRMLQFAARLEAMQHRVTSLTFYRRAAQGKPPWCEFDCETPEAGLPVSRMRET